MLLMQNLTAQTIVSFQWHNHTHRYGNPPINILRDPDESKSVTLNVQSSAVANASGGSECFVCCLHLSLFLTQPERKLLDS